MSRKVKSLLCKALLMRQKNIHIGNNTTFGRGTVFYAPTEMNIGNNVYIGKYCTLDWVCEVSGKSSVGGEHHEY